MSHCLQIASPAKTAPIARPGRIALLPLAALVLALGSPAAAERQHLEISAPDGLQLQTTYFPAAGPGPGVLMLHQCNRDRHSWEETAVALSDAGLHVLTFDFRGFGESTNETNHDFRSQFDALWPQFDGDVDRAFDFLVSLPSVDGEHVGVVSASCGGTQALRLALRRPEVRAIVFLSSSLPWIESEEIETFEENGGVSILAVAADADEKTAERTVELFRGSTEPGSKLILYKGELHGVPLFTRDATLLPTLVSWLDDELGRLSGSRR